MYHPHTTNDVIFQLKIRFTIPSNNDVDAATDGIVDFQDNLTKQKASLIQITDGMLDRDIGVSNNVLVRQKKVSKLTLYNESHLFIVINSKGTTLTAKPNINDRTITKNISQYKRIPHNAKFLILKEEEEYESPEENEGNNEQPPLEPDNRVQPTNDRRKIYPTRFWMLCGDLFPPTNNSQMYK